MSETIKRIITGFSIAIIYALFFQIELWNFFPLYLFVCAVTFIVINEFYSMYFTDKSSRVYKHLGTFFSIIVLTFIYLQSLNIFRRSHDLGFDFLDHILDFIPEDFSAISGIFILMFVTLGVYNIIGARLKGSVYATGIVFLGILYIPLTLSFIFLLRSLPYGAFYVWLVSFCTVMTDVWGYTFGRLFGRHKISLPVSPNKTWEGYSGAFIAQIFFTMGFYYFVQLFFDVPDYGMWHLIGISIIIYTTSVFGDLFESLVKRNADAKDSGSLLPGHGGLLDRVDSIMFSLPAFYFFVQITS